MKTNDAINCETVSLDDTITKIEGVNKQITDAIQDVADYLAFMDSNAKVYAESGHVLSSISCLNYICCTSKMTLKKMENISRRQWNSHNY